MQRIGVGLLAVVWLGAAKAETRGVRVIGASSSLPGKTKVMEWSGGKPHWTGATFQPASAMDGSLATSWCEGARGPGIGQWIEVQLDQPIREVEIAGGFRKLAMPHGEAPVDATQRDLGDWEEEMDTWFDRSLRTYQSNSRPAIIELTTQDGQVLERFQLGDRTLDRYRFRVSLAAGRYRLRIAQVYPGTRFQDTCIAELQFRELQKADPVDPSWLPEVVRPFAAPEKCRAASGVKVLPREVMFLGARYPSTPGPGAPPAEAGIAMAARTASGTLLPISDTFSCMWRGGTVTCFASGEDARKEVFQRADDYPEWDVELKTETAGAQGPREWAGAYRTVGRKVLYRITVRPDATAKGAFVVSALRDNAMVESAQYTCVPLGLR